MSHFMYLRVLLCSLLLTVSSGNLIYISPFGNDLNNGSSVAPVLTFSRGMNLINLKEGSTLYFDQGIYRNINIELVNLGNITLTLQALNPLSKPIFYKHDIITRNAVSMQYNTLLVYNTSGVTLSGLSFQVNHHNAIIGLGSHIYVNTSQNIAIIDCEIMGNHASIGSGLYVVSSQNITLTNNIVANNYAMRRDLTLEDLFTRTVGSYFNITNVIMSGNIPFFNFEKNIMMAGIAGGLYIADSSISVIGCTFRNNSASFGGAVFISPGTVWKSNACLFDANFAAIQGSVIYSNDVAHSKSIELPNCMFLNNFCRIWSCKMIYSEIWQNQFNRKLSDYSPYFVLIVDIIILCVVGLIILSGGLQFFCIFLCKKKKKDSPSNTPDSPSVSPSTKITPTDPPKEDTPLKATKDQTTPIETNPSEPAKDVIKEEKPALDTTESIQAEDKRNAESGDEDDDLVGNSKILNTISNAYETVSNHITVAYIAPVIDSGLFSIILQWLFSLSGLTYPAQIPKVWRVAHSLFFCFVLILTALKAFSTSFGVPTFFYDIFDYINIGFGSAEYILLYGMPVTCYFAMLIGSNILKSVIFRERKTKQFAYIVLLTGGLLFIGFVISVVASVLSLDFFEQTTPQSVVSNLVYIIYWVITALIICFLIVITVVLVSFMISRITEFFDTIENLAKANKFSYEESILNYSRLKQYLSAISLKTSWYLGPILIHLGVTITLEIIMEIWGISGFYSGRFQGVRYAVIVCYSLLALFLFLSYAVVTQHSLSCKSKLLALIIKIGNESGMKRYVRTDSEVHVKLSRKKTMLFTAKDVIRELHEFDEFLSINTFEYALFGIIPLYITTIMQYATIFVSLFAAARTLQSTLSATFYST